MSDEWVASTLRRRVLGVRRGFTPKGRCREWGQVSFLCSLGPRLSAAGPDSQPRVHSVGGPCAGRGAERLPGGEESPGLPLREALRLAPHPTLPGPS